MKRKVDVEADIRADGLKWLLFLASALLLQYGIT